MIGFEKNVGFILGFGGVILFGGTLPTTRLTVAAIDPPLLTAARAKRYLNIELLKDQRMRGTITA
jgi:hypothetical protein